MNDSTIERHLRQALDIEPSPEFVARVHARVATEARRRRNWSWSLVPAVAAILVLLAIVATRQSVAIRRPVDPLVARSLSLPIQSEMVARYPSLARPRAGRMNEFIDRRANHRQTSEPEVLISPDEARGIRLLIAGLADGRIDPASLPPDTRSITDIVIPPIAIPPIDGSPDIKGARP